MFAFGSPFGIKFSMSRGIVSGLGRSEGARFLGMNGGYTNFIQTDAAMNPGNSGGPLVNANGMVVGMNAAIANNFEFNGLPRQQLEAVDPETRALVESLARSLSRPTQGQSAGIGFAIPLETVEAVVGQILDDTEMVVLRGYLGINLAGELAFYQRDPDDFRDRRARELARAVAGFDGRGVLVAGTPENQPAARAGILEGDVIISIAGRPTPSIDVLRSIVSVQEPGQPIAVRLWRDGAETDLQVRLGAAYNQPNGTLDFVEGSESMTLDEIRNVIRSGS